MKTELKLTAAAVLALALAGGTADAQTAGGSAAGGGVGGSAGAATGATTPSGTLSPGPGVAPSTENLPGLTPPPAPGMANPGAIAAGTPATGAGLGSTSNVPGPLPTTPYAQNGTATVVPNGTSCPSAGVTANTPPTSTAAGGSLAPSGTGSNLGGSGAAGGLGPTQLPALSSNNRSAGIGTACPPSAEHGAPPITATTQPGSTTFPGGTTIVTPPG